MFKYFYKIFCSKYLIIIQKRNFRIIAAAFLFPFLIFQLLNIIYPLPVEKLNRDRSTAVYSSNDELLSLYLANDDYWRMETEIKDVPEFLRNAVIEYEDKYFYYHPGFNPVSLIRALITNIRSRDVVCGGSTITMQVARMIEPKPRTYRSKIIEIFRAIQLECAFSKNEILEYYFNIAPYGGNIEGIGAAAYFYFGKSARTLSKSEALALVGLPNSPSRLRPDTHNAESRQHRDKIAKLLMDRGLISETVCVDIISDAMPEKRFEKPFSAPHFSRLVKSKYKRESNIKTTIDLKIQSLCEKSLSQYMISLMQKGITNGAIVVIDNKTRSIKSMVGSSDFFDPIHAGQVNGAIAPRSPGSTLKPFAYALALDEGIISPRMMLSDVPIDYSGYTPINYDEQYRGGIPAENALKLSLNVPAVKLYSKLGEKFYSLLKYAGVTTIVNPRDYYGLPLVLGSCEMNLLELTNLYATLACDGEYQPYRMIDSEPERPPSRIFTSASSYIISEILSDIQRTDLPTCWESTKDIPKIAWKTGTSYGNRDAWCVGYNPDYTVGVWVGNFSGKDSNELIGVNAAAPLMFDIFNSITNSISWFERPESIGIREVCSVSGMLPSKDCPHTVQELYICGVSPIETCQMHKKFIIDNQTGLRFPYGYTANESGTEKVFEIWPPDIASWRKREGYPVDEIPPLMATVSHYSYGPKPLILSPQNGADFVLRDEAPVEHQRILLEASASNIIQELYWFVDGELLITCKPEESQFYYPKVGKHKIACVDSDGNSSTVTIFINASDDSS